MKLKIYYRVQIYTKQNVLANENGLDWINTFESSFQIHVIREKGLEFCRD